VLHVWLLIDLGLAAWIFAYLIGRPFPNVSDHVERSARAGSVGEPADLFDLAGLEPDVCRAGSELITPRVQASVAASRGRLPLALGGKPLARPFGVVRCVLPGHIGDRQLVLARGIAPILPRHRSGMRGRVDELLVLGICHFGAINEEGSELNGMSRLFSRI